VNKAKYERHHILPKGIFPEYVSFKHNPWNMAKLTPRQHFIAHRILWKAIPNNYHTTYAVFRMSRYGDNKISSKEYEKLKNEYATQQAVKTKEMFATMSDEAKIIRSTKISKSAKDKVLAKDDKGNIIKVSKDVFDKSDILTGHTKGMITVKDGAGAFLSVNQEDPRYVSGELVGVNKGRTFSDETKCLWSSQRKGVPKTEDTRQKMRKPKPRVTCPHCGKEGGANTIRRYHFDNCKLKTA
jgi:hypothetical protein